jgi:asparagine synthase (glutamine-hydrolysing)
MCGIAGFLKHGARDSRDVLAMMCDRLAHRGPDAYGWMADDESALGHRRLSIIDLSTGDQPMGNEDGTVQVVFNGEIYNYRELRAELQAKGHRFRTESDTEVLAHLYEEAGESMPEFLNGMFAFAIWDAPRQRLFLARDRMGKKPLYYTDTIPGFGFAFASELKALAAMPGFDARVDERSVAEFLALSYVPDPRTIYRGVAKLEPAHSLTVDRAGMRSRRYWAPVFRQRGQRPQEAADELAALAEDAVSRRMISDVPLGAFLSGGVDSSAVVAYMSRRATSVVRTFSIGFTNKRFDELEHARAVANLYHTEHQEKVVTPRIEDVLDVMARHMDEPFGDPSIIPTLYLAEMTRRYVTVALSGDGADEVFGGYRRYFYGVLEENLRHKFPGFFRRSAIAWGGRHYPKFDYLPQVFRARSLLTNLSLEIGDAYFSSMTAFRDEGLQAVLSPEMRRALGGYAPREWFRDKFTAVRELHPLEQMQAVDFQTYLPGDILVKADRATMIHSLEARAPWLDYRIVEFAGGLPPAAKLDGRVGKAIFKKVVRPLLPETNVSRKKMGFSVPLAEWFRTSLKPVFESMVLGKEAGAFIDLAEARRLWAQHQSSVFNHERKLWNLLMLAMWQSRRLAGVESATVGAAHLA